MRYQYKISALVSHFEWKPVVELQNVGCFLELGEIQMHTSFPYQPIHCICTFRRTVLFYSYDREIVFI